MAEREVSVSSKRRLAFANSCVVQPSYAVFCLIDGNMNATCIAASALMLAYQAQSASFQNLGFEQANTNNVVPLGPNLGYSGTTTDLLPGWQMSYGTAPVSDVGLNAFALSPGYRTLASTGGGNQFFNASVFPIQGNYALILSPRDFGPYEPQSILQSGTIPADVGQLSFLTFGHPLELRINDMLVPLSYTYQSPPGTANDLRFGTAVADIAAFAGMDVALRFSTMVPGAYINGIDNIQFIPVPEPGVLALGTLAACGFLWRRRSRHPRTQSTSGTG